MLSTVNQTPALQHLTYVCRGLPNGQQYCFDDPYSLQNLANWDKIQNTAGGFGNMVRSASGHDPIVEDFFDKSKKSLDVVQQSGIFGLQNLKADWDKVNGATAGWGQMVRGISGNDPFTENVLGKGRKGLDII